MAFYGYCILAPHGPISQSDFPPDRLVSAIQPLGPSWGLRKILEALAQDLEDRGKIELSECFIDGTFVVAKKGGAKAGKTKRGKGTKLMVIADASGLHSPCTRLLLAHMKSPLSKLPSLKLSRWDDPDAWGTAPDPLGWMVPVSAP